MPVFNISDQAWMELGLPAAGFDNFGRRSYESNRTDFKDTYGASPKSLEAMWVDLQSIGEIDDKANPYNLLVCLRWMKQYPTQKQLRGMFKEMNTHKLRDVTRFWVDRLEALKAIKYKDINDNDDGYMLGYTIDGTHFRIEEPRPWSTKWSSFKFGGAAAVAYEVVLKTNKLELVWLNGPFPAATHDKRIFRMFGLLDKLKLGPAGRKLIADDGYIAVDLLEFLSLRNELDPREIQVYKERCLSRHESFNYRLKTFKCLDSRFRHGVEMHGKVTNAVAVILLYNVDDGEPLFDPFLV